MLIVKVTLDGGVGAAGAVFPGPGAALCPPLQAKNVKPTAAAAAHRRMDFPSENLKGKYGAQSIAEV
jgi:hypothetical protein